MKNNDNLKLVLNCWCPNSDERAQASRWQRRRVIRAFSSCLSVMGRDMAGARNRRPSNTSDSDRDASESDAGASVDAGHGATATGIHCRASLECFGESPRRGPSHFVQVETTFRVTPDSGPRLQKTVTPTYPAYAYRDAATEPRALLAPWLKYVIINLRRSCQWSWSSQSVRHG